MRPVIPGGERTGPPDAVRYRWLVLSVFMLSTAINYLDRATLAALAPTLRGEFHLSNTQIGWIGSAFNITYAASAPLAGMLIDTIGLNWAISVAVGLWSCAGIATGFTRGLGGLVGCRAVLGAAEAAGIPAAGKAIHQYLRPAERALGNAVNQAGVSLGAILAPPLAVAIAWRSGWRAAFVVTGVLGLAWIPIWNWAARRTSTAPLPKLKAGASAAILRDRRLWAFVAANALNMTGYYLWFNWATLYLVDVHHLTQQQSAWYTWIPPLFAGLGGVSGGWLSLRIVERGIPMAAARFRVGLGASVIALATVALPLAPNAAWASALISLAIFAVAAFSVNIYTLPLDTFGGAPAAFAVGILVASYGAVSAVISPAIGAVIDAHGYTPVTTVVAFTPLAACAVLWGTRAVR
ncbi:MAG TPA: MFS transporter [Candidatus Solibacter sp.]|nr:MFS transporter [Candidatus Solibacter sp.]